MCRNVGRRAGRCSGMSVGGQDGVREGDRGEEGRGGVQDSGRGREYLLPAGGPIQGSMDLVQEFLVFQ